MSTDNLYWPVYKNLEREVLALSNHIHFDDNQLIVYSVKIAELLLRCVTEIEAISKDLYETNGGDMYPKDNNGNDRQLYFDTDCLEYFERIWTLSKKQVIVSAISFYFKKDENKILTPLKNANKHGKCDWKRAYQSIKHNRSKEIKQANVKHLVRALAALYLLNIYYRNESFEINRFENIFKRKEFEYNFDSDIFSIQSTLSIFWSAMSPYHGKDKICLEKEDDLKQVYVFMPADKKAYIEYVSIFRKNSGISTDDINGLLKKHNGSITNLGQNANGKAMSLWVDPVVHEAYNRILWRLELNKNQVIIIPKEG